MSMDNGVYILETLGPEYRVAYSHAIGNIYGNYDETNCKWIGDMDRMMDVFGQSPVFSDLYKAIDKASEIGYIKGYLEDEVSIIRDFRELKFGQL